VIYDRRACISIPQRPRLSGGRCLRLDRRQRDSRHSRHIKGEAPPRLPFLRRCGGVPLLPRDPRGIPRDEPEGRGCGCRGSHPQTRAPLPATGFPVNNAGRILRRGGAEPGLINDDVSRARIEIQLFRGSHPRGEYCSCRISFTARLRMMYPRTT